MVHCNYTHIFFFFRVYIITFIIINVIYKLRDLSCTDHVYNLIIIYDYNFLTIIFYVALLLIQLRNNQVLDVSHFKNVEGA
jgi:hypothetical protein